VSKGGRVNMKLRGHVCRGLFTQLPCTAQRDSDRGSSYSEHWISSLTNRTSTTVFVKSRVPICFRAAVKSSRCCKGTTLGTITITPAWSGSLPWRSRKSERLLVTNVYSCSRMTRISCQSFESTESAVTDMVCAMARRMGDGDKGCMQAFVNQKLHVGVAIFRRWRVVRTAFRFAQGRAAGRPRRGKACM
jgi:hypothetical protein